MIEDESRLKCEQARPQRHKLAKIPEPRVMDTFPFDRQPKLNKKKMERTTAEADALAKLDVSALRALRKRSRFVH